MLGLVLFTWCGPVVGDSLDDIRQQLAKEEQRIEALEQRLAARKATTARRVLPEATLRAIVAEYLRDNPGAGMPTGVQTGYDPAAGFFIRGASQPRYSNWKDESAIPFDLRVRGVLQFDYTFYKVTDNLNHQSGAEVNPPLGDVDQLSVKRATLTFSGNAFDPELRYQIRIQADTRSLPGVENLSNTSRQFDLEENGEDEVSRATVSHAVRLGQSFISYDLHPCCSFKGCGEDCPDGQVRYAPTLTLIAGYIAPLVGLDDYLGRTTANLLEKGIADYYFAVPSSAAVGVRLKALEDRFFLQALVSNGNQSALPNGSLDDLPGLNLGVWYDIGGGWNEQRKAWDLFGTTMVDLDYSCRPVVRVGAGISAVWFGSREIYGDEESGTIRVMPAPPLGQRLIALLDGTPTNTEHALDSFDCIIYNVYVAGKYRGFNLSTEWWLRDLNDLVPASGTGGIILYQDSAGETALYPQGHPLLDYGMTTQVGYFIWPKRLQVGARWSYIRGESGDLNGDGTGPVVRIPGVGAVRVLNGAFHNFHEADEYTFNWSYYFRGNSLKWLNDIGWYTGGNPASGRSTGGFLPGVDGWLLRSRVQIAF
jgi:hypothetical protein